MPLHLEPFQYDAPYRSPYIGTLMELAQRNAQIQAQAVTQSAQAQAHALDVAAAARAQAMAQNGENWNRTFNTLGLAISRVPDQIRLAKSAAIEDQLNQAKLRDVQQRQRGEAAVDTMMQGDQLPAGDVGPRQESYLTEEGLFDVPKMNAALAQSGMAHLAPELLRGAEQINDSVSKAKALDEQRAQAHTIAYGRMAWGAKKLVDAGWQVPDALDFVSQAGLASKLFSPQEYGQIRDHLASLQPDQQQAALMRMIDAAAEVAPKKTLAEGAKEFDIFDRQTATNPKDEKPTEYSLLYDLTSPDPEKRRRAQAAYDAKRGADIKPGTIEDYVARARRMATDANGGVALNDAQQAAVDNKAINTFRNLQKDPDMQALLASNEQLRNLILHQQLDQQPTKEDATAVANQIVTHKLAPSQLGYFGGFGTGGAAFKRMVGIAAIKMDPEFDWEEAESEYQLAKSPKFQNLVRYMDTTLDSMPRLVENAKVLANGKVTSINKLVNAGQHEFNKVELGRFNTDRLLVADEIGNIIQNGTGGSGVSDEKLKQAQSIIKESDSPELIYGSLDEAYRLIGFRRKHMTRGTPEEKRNPKTEGLPDYNTIGAKKGPSGIRFE